ncbi:MAG: response regulator [Polyangiaceae bacterium]
MSLARVTDGWMARRPMVLLVDDEIAILQVVSDLLESAGYEVATASDGEAALRNLRAREPDAVVLDVMLPHKSGLDVVREMRSDPALARTPVVLMTAVPWSTDAEPAHGCVVVHKPFTVERLLGAIEGLLRERTG